MGPQQILRAIGAGVLIATVAAHGTSARAAPARERVAVIDLGPADDGAARRKLGVALVAAGLDPVMGDGIDDALAGIAGYRDDATLAVHMAEAKRAFGE